MQSTLSDGQYYTAPVEFSWNFSVKKDENQMVFSINRLDQ